MGAREVVIEVRFGSGALTIPANEYKTARSHVVPLVPQAVAILEISFRGGKGDYVLSTTEGEKPIRGIAKYYQTRLPRTIMAQNGAAIAPFVSHDIRRSVASHVAESLGVGGEPLIARLLGHSCQGSVTATLQPLRVLKGNTPRHSRRRLANFPGTDVSNAPLR